MEGNGRRGFGFNFGYIIGDPFALATVSIAIVRNALLYHGREQD